MTDAASAAIDIDLLLRDYDRVLMENEALKAELRRLGAKAKEVEEGHRNGKPGTTYKQMVRELFGYSGIYGQIQSGVLKRDGLR